MRLAEALGMLWYDVNENHAFEFDIQQEAIEEITDEQRLNTWRL